MLLASQDIIKILTARFKSNFAPRPHTPSAPGEYSLSKITSEESRPAIYLVTD